MHSNATLTIINKKTGGRLGYNTFGGIDETIPQGAFLSIDGIEYASIQNTSASYTVLVNGTGTGRFTLTVNSTTAAGIMASFSYSKVPIVRGSIASLDIVPDQAFASPPSLTITSGRVTTSVSAVRWIQVGDAAIALGVNSTTPHDPIGRTKTINSQQDQFAYAWIKFVNVLPPGRTVQFKWFSPDGKLFWNDTRQMPSPDQRGYSYWMSYIVTSGIRVKGSAVAQKVGEWKVVVLVDGAQVKELTFAVTGPAPQPALQPEPEQVQPPRPPQIQQPPPVGRQPPIETPPQQPAPQPYPIVDIDYLTYGQQPWLHLPCSSQLLQ